MCSEAIFMFKKIITIAFIITVASQIPAFAELTPLQIRVREAFAKMKKDHQQIEEVAKVEDDTEIVIDTENEEDKSPIAAMAANDDKYAHVLIASDQDEEDEEEYDEEENEGEGIVVATAPTKETSKKQEAEKSCKEEVPETGNVIPVASLLALFTAFAIIKNVKLKDRAFRQKIKEPEQCKKLLKEILLEEIDFEIPKYEYTPLVILLSGVNGVGKTTTIGKLAHNFMDEGKTVIVAAADTFRAAASEQLEVWGKRAGVRVIKHGEGSDPAAVVFDTISAAKAHNTDVILIDTAGRLHNKVNLMNELKKICRVVDRELPDADFRKFLVLDATTGQNAVAQAEIFSETIDTDGIILTKLDGTAKGGVIIAISNTLELPVVYVGVGEKIDDLIPFNAEDFITALFE